MYPSPPVGLKRKNEGQSDILLFQVTVTLEVGNVPLPRTVFA